MPENMTKKRKAAAARKARRRRRQRRQLMLTSLFLLVCVGAFASLSPFCHIFRHKNLRNLCNPLYYSVRPEKNEKIAAFVRKAKQS